MQRDGASRLAQRTNYATVECIFELFLLKKWPQLCRKLPHQNFFCRLPIRSLSENTRIMWSFLHYVQVLTIHLWAICTHKMAITEWKTPMSGIKFNFLFRGLLGRSLSKCQDNARFPSLCKVSRNGFISYLYSKNGHNSVQNGHMGKKFKTCFEDHLEGFPKIKLNQRFPSLWNVSGNFY